MPDIPVQRDSAAVEVGPTCLAAAYQQAVAVGRETRTYDVRGGDKLLIVQPT